MADPEKDYTPIKIEQDRPIVTQPWTPPYKPATCALQKSWQNAMATANNAAGDPNKRGGGGANGRDPRGGDFFYNPPSHSPKSAQPHLPGGSGWTPAGGGGGGGSSGGAFNAFQYVAGGVATPGGGNNNNSNFGTGAVAGGMMLPSNLRNLATLDEDDEYDERVNTMRSSMQGRTPIGGSTARRKTRAQREREREEYKRQHEAMLQQGYQSGGEVDEGCVGAMGEDDEVRDLRLRFGPGAAHEDGTGHTAYAAAVHHRRRGGGGNSMRTPPPATGGDTYGNSSSGFRPPGLRTPVYDPTSNLPGPVARHQKRQQHHMLRMLGGVGPTGASGGGFGGGGAGADGQQLFSPHAIPTGEDESTRRKNRFDNPEMWLFGRDESVEDVLKKHFLKDEEEKNKKKNAAAAAGGATPVAAHQHSSRGGAPQHHAAPQTPTENVRTINLRR